MTKSIIELAIEAGWEDEQFSNRFPIMAKEFHERLERFATLLKAAHIAELLAGVEMPEPTDFCDVPFQHIWGYTDDQLRTAVAAAVAKERQRMASREQMLTDAELADPQYMKAYIEGCNETITDCLRHSKALTGERDAYQQTADKLAMDCKMLREALGCVTVTCGTLHHAKKDQHGIGEPCQVEQRVKAALEQTK